MRFYAIGVATLVVLAAAGCGANPAQNLTPTGPTTFGTPTGSETTDYHEPEPTPPNPTPTPPPPMPTPGPTPSPYTWMPEGPRLDNASAGFGGVIADTSTIQLTDGRWRMFLYAGGQYRSAVSPDGLSFTMEGGARLAQGLGHTRVLRLADGRIRAYSQVGDGIASSVSSDEGLTFTREGGLRVTAAAAGFTPSGVSIVRTSGGLWRMYFSSLPRPGDGPLPHKVLSASSVDLLTWMLDPGVRLGPGAALTESAEHPAAIANPDGSVSLFYFRNTNFRMMMATASDGLTFTSEYDTGISQANDPDLIRLSDGSVRMYYNWGDNASGAIYSALYVGPPFAATDPAPAAGLPLVPPVPASGSSPLWRRFKFSPAF